MFCRPWYEIEFEGCLSNSIVFSGNMWNWSIEVASSGECFKYSNPFQRTESGPMAVRSFFWNFSRLVSLAVDWFALPTHFFSFWLVTILKRFAGSTVFSLSYSDFDSDLLPGDGIGRLSLFIDFFFFCSNFKAD